MSKLSRRDAEAIAKLEAIYASLPTVACQGRCSGSCGVVPLTDLEARRLQVVSHRKPRVLPVVAHTEMGSASQRCVYLTDAGRCSVYAARPLLCRVWGVLHALSCPFGCVPSRWVGSEEFMRIALAVEDIGGGRVLRTDVTGVVDGGESFAVVDAQSRLAHRRTSDAIARDDERTRHLRALFGGRIIIAVEESND